MLSENMHISIYQYMYISIHPPGIWLSRRVEQLQISIIIIIIIIIFTGRELSLGGSSPYTNTERTNNNKYT